MAVRRFTSLRRISLAPLLVLVMVFSATVTVGCGSSKPKYRIEVVADQNSPLVKALAKALASTPERYTPEVGIAGLRDDSILVLSTAAHKVYKLSPDRTQLSLFAGDGLAGQHLDPNSATKSEIIPNSLAVLADGSVLIGDNGYRILRVSPNSEHIAVFAAAVESNPLQKGCCHIRTVSGKELLFATPSLAVLPDQSVAVASGLHVFRISSNGKRVDVAAGGGRVGLKENLPGVRKAKIPLDTEHPTNNNLYTTKIAALSDGSLLIYDRNRSKVLKLSADGKRLTPYAGGGHDDVSSQPAKLDVASLNGGLGGLPDGSGLIATVTRILRISPDDKSAQLFAGSGKENGFDPNDPTKTSLVIRAIASTQNGSVLVIANDLQIYRISPK